MANTDQESLTSGQQPTTVSTRRDPLLCVCKVYGVIVALVALLCVFVNVVSAIQSFKNASNVFDGIFRCYAVLLALLIVVAETEWGFIFKFWRVLEYWAGRGMLQIFVAVMTRAFPDTTKETKNLLVVQYIASYMLIACGVIYVILGVLCIGFLKRARQHKEVSRDQAVKDLKELESRREELEALLLSQRS